MHRKALSIINFYKCRDNSKLSRHFILYLILYFTYYQSYIQEGAVATEELIFLKKGDNLVQLVSDIFGKEGRMVLKDRKKLKAGNTLTKADCAKLSKEFEKIQAMEKDMVFKYPDPILSEKDEQLVAKIQGEWLSKEDPKAGVKIENGIFRYIHMGQKSDALRYIYYPVCPNDCNPVAKMPCLLVIEANNDATCFAIIKADGKSLDISQIGGTGNTNHYVKKK